MLACYTPSLNHSNIYISSTTHYLITTTVSSYMCSFALNSSYMLIFPLYYYAHHILLYPKTLFLLLCTLFILDIPLSLTCSIPLFVIPLLNHLLLYIIEFLHSFINSINSRELFARRPLIVVRLHFPRYLFTVHL